MKEFKTSYIFTKNEMLFLLLGAGNGATPLYGYILDEFFTPEDLDEKLAAEGLMFKRMARGSVDALVLEPVVGFLAKAAAVAEKLWIKDCGGLGKRVFAVRCERLWLLISEYAPAPDSWRVTPCRSGAELAGLFPGIFSGPDVTLISASDGKLSITRNSEISPMEDDHDG